MTTLELKALCKSMKQYHELGRPDLALNVLNYVLSDGKDDADIDESSKDSLSQTPDE